MIRYLIQYNVLYNAIPKKPLPLSLINYRAEDPFTLINISKEVNFRWVG